MFKILSFLFCIFDVGICLELILGFLISFPHIEKIKKLIGIILCIGFQGLGELCNVGGEGFLLSLDLGG